MPKNILIFSDGTGQVGGLRPDQRHYGNHAQQKIERVKK